jgi:hypothetical protein
VGITDDPDEPNPWAYVRDLENEADIHRGIKWWVALTEEERIFWLDEAKRTLRLSLGRPAAADAWRAYKNRREQDGGIFDKYEARPARYSDEVAGRRLQEFHSAYAMNRLEGAPESEDTERLIYLLSTGRISESEYLAISLRMAKGELV